MASQENHQILLNEVPSDKLTVDHFTLQATPMPEPSAGEVLVKTRYLSLDPAMRAWMQGQTYRDKMESGTIMAGGLIGEVVASNDPAFEAGDFVSSGYGWQEFASVPADQLQKLPKTEPLSYQMGVFGVTGLTAYFGITEIGLPQPGETVVVSTAAGAVGCIAAQISKILGARVVGITSSDKKCDWLTGELGLDAAINYREQHVGKVLKETCPDGIDVYFDNVGGDIFEKALFGMNMNGRIICCGAVASYDGAPPAHGPRGVPGLLVVRRLTMRGFIVMDFYDKKQEALDQLGAWVADGKLKPAEDIIDGFENAPQGLVGVLAGENIGKRIVRVA